MLFQSTYRPTLNTTNKKYFNEIDTFRAIAVIAVIINHINASWLPGGYLGVDMFFVISGFVVTSSLHASTAINFKSYITSFYSKRIKRLYPALLVCLFIFSLLSIALLPGSQNYIKTSFSALFGFSNVFLAINSFDYFSEQATHNPFTHTWSLGVEEQFYFIFPFLFYYACKYRKKIFVLSFTFILSLAFFLYIEKVNVDFAFYLMPSRFWQLCLGALIYELTITSHVKKFNPHLILLPFLIMAFGLIFFKDFQAYSTIIITFATALCLAFVKESSRERPYFLFKPVLAIGLASYSLYLYHWPILILLKETISTENEKFFLLIGLMIVLSYFSYQIEKKLRKTAWGIPTVATLTLIFLCIVALNFNFKKTEETLFVGNPQVKYGGYQLGGERIRKYKKCYYKSKSIKGLWDSQDLFNKHYSKCDLIKAARDNNIFTFGNSYLESLLPSIHNIAIEKQSNLHFYAKGGLKVYPHNIKQSPDKIQYSRNLLTYFFQYVKDNSQQGDIVILSTPLYHFFNNDMFYNENNEPVSGVDALGLFTQFLNNKKNELNKIGVQLYFITSFPLLKKSIVPRNCYQPWSEYNNNCSLDNTLRKDGNKKIIKMNKMIHTTLGRSYISLYSEISEHMGTGTEFYKLYYNDDHISLNANNKIVEHLTRSIEFP